MYLALFISISRTLTRKLPCGPSQRCATHLSSLLCLQFCNCFSLLSLSLPGCHDSLLWMLIVMNTKQGNYILASTQFHSYELFWEKYSYANQITVASLNTINLIIVIESKNIFLLRWCLSTTHSGRCGCECVLRTTELCKPDYTCQRMNTMSYIES